MRVATSYKGILFFLSCSCMHIKGETSKEEKYDCMNVHFTDAVFEVFSGTASNISY